MSPFLYLFTKSSEFIIWCYRPSGNCIASGVGNERKNREKKTQKFALYVTRLQGEVASTSPAFPSGFESPPKVRGVVDESSPGLRRVDLDTTPL